MKPVRMKAPLLIILTCIIVCIGFFMPEITNAIQENKNEGRIESFEVAELIYSDSSSDKELLAEKLNIVSNEYQVKSINASETFDEEDAQKYAEAALRFLYENGIEYSSEEILTNRDSELVLASLEKEGDQAILWFFNYFSNDSGQFINIVIEHETGKMLAFNTMSDSKSTIAEINTEADYKEYTVQAESWADSLTEYYGFDEYVLDASHNSDASRFYITFTYNGNKKLTLPYTVFGSTETISFNQ